MCWGRCCLMFHLLFVPRYLDNVPTDLGRGEVTLACHQAVWKVFFISLSVYFAPNSLSLTYTNTHPCLFFPFLVIFTLLTRPVTSYHRPKSLFSFFSSPIHPHSSSALLFLCSALTLSSLPHVLLQAYSALDAEFYCHSVYTGTL